VEKQRRVRFPEVSGEGIKQKERRDGQAGSDVGKGRREGGKKQNVRENGGREQGMPKATQ